MGCICPVGNKIDTMWENIKAGQSGIGLITQYDASEYKSKIAGEVKGFDPVTHFGSRDARRMDRFTQFALYASEQALAHSGFEVTDENRDRIGAVIGSGIGGMGTLFEQMKVFYTRGPNRDSRT
jgi:3-oxoacyl-[acyl-carrier-protein] synthase II